MALEIVPKSAGLREPCRIWSWENIPKGSVPDLSYTNRTGPPAFAAIFDRCALIASFPGRLLVNTYSKCRRKWLSVDHREIFGRNPEPSVFGENLHYT
jgi:hypothetical protein